MDTSSVDLPDEIIELILSKCPVESLVRFKSVSKSWQSIISDPRFSRLHRIQRSKLLEDQKKFFLWEEKQGSGKRDYGLHLMRLEDENFRTESESVLGCPSYGWYLIPLCSCDGLILFFVINKVSHEEFMLWNPLIRKHIIIPHFNPKAFGNWNKLEICHLYHDSITNDYKIVCLDELECYVVYSCENASWEIKDLPCEWNDVDQICTTGIDGCIYGICYSTNEIISFDDRDGKVHKFPQPEEVETLHSVKLEAVLGRLCLYGFSDYSEQKLQLWVMEENESFEKCWRKLISKEKREPLMWYSKPIYLTNKDDVVLWAKVPKTEYGKYKHFIYNPRGNCSFKEIDFINEEDTDLWIDDGDQYYFPYSENLEMSSSSICSC